MDAKRLPTAYVMDSDPQALSVVRDLGRHGVPVITLTYKPHSPGRFSRYATARVLPRIDERDDAWLEYLLAEGRRQGRRSVLIPCTDRFVAFVAHHRKLLDPYFVIPLPSREVLARILDKRQQYRIVQAAGIPLPRTIEPMCDADVAALTDARWSYPCILKPAIPHQWIRSYQNGYKLLVAQSRDELVAGYRDARVRGLEVLIQERIPGPETALYSLYFYSNAQADMLASGVGHKLRQFPLNIGNGTLRESVQEPRVLELGARVCRALGFHGIGNIEFRRDPRDGEFKLMELNTRSGLGGGVVIDSGLPLPYLAYRDLIGQPLPPQGVSRTGVRWWYLETDVRAFQAYRQRGQLTLWGWLRSIARARSFAHFAWDDLVPFLVAMRAFIWKWRRGLLAVSQEMRPMTPARPVLIRAAQAARYAPEANRT